MNKTNFNIFFKWPCFGRENEERKEEVAGYSRALIGKSRGKLLKFVSKINSKLYQLTTLCGGKLRNGRCKKYLQENVIILFGASFSLKWHTPVRYLIHQTVDDNYMIVPFETSFALQDGDIYRQFSNSSSFSGLFVSPKPDEAINSGDKLSMTPA